ncbi:ubiquitinyl hydrolase 1 [Ranunculus cassubicifolius]
MVVKDVPPSSTFTWTIENFPSLKFNKKHYSDVFVAGGCRWRIEILKNKKKNSLSIYLAVADSLNFLFRWSKTAQFSLSVVDQDIDVYTVRKFAPLFRFTEDKAGFEDFMKLSEVYDENRGYILNERCKIEVEVDVHKPFGFWNYDSKKETTSYVGLKNQGATCYMNSLLQTLYHIPCFRKAVYRMPTTENGGMPLALQTLFYKLQYKGSSVGTKELTKSFGWSSADSFMQHDVQELNRVLCEKLENKMKGTVVEGTIQNLFEGHHMNYIDCIDVDYKSTRKESYYDIQLDVKGCRDIYASFDKYVEVERMEGDNKYNAEEHGLQDAKKGVLFIDFPPVLQLQLKRFEYDFRKDTMVKINDKYEFPLTLDLDRENWKYLSPDSDKGVRNLYTLHSVLVHRGGVSGGHYYAFIQPTLADQWFKFDDERITKEDRRMAVEENYGGEDIFRFTKCSNAYMLVYIRDSDKGNIMCEVNEKDIAQDIGMILKEKERTKKERVEAHLYTTIKVARDQDIFEQIGKDRYFDLVDHDKVHSFRVKRQIPFKDFKEEVAREFGVPVQFQRFWTRAAHTSLTYRPGRPITHQEELKPVMELGHDLKLFLEVELGLDSCPIALPNKTEENIMLFAKVYDPKREHLQYLGRLFVRGDSRPNEILSKLNQMAGFSSNEEIDLYEELSFRPAILCQLIDKERTFYNSKLCDGDIVCFQRSIKAEASEREEFRYPDLPSFFKYIHNRKVVQFHSLVKPEEDDIYVELSMTSTYDEVVEILASRLGLDDPSKIRLSSPGRSTPLKYRGVKNLSDMLGYGSKGDIISYEALDIPLPELEGLRTIDVYFHHSTHSITLPKPSSIGDLILKLKAKVETSHPNADLRLFEVTNHQISRRLRSSEKIEDRYFNLHAEEILEEENNLGRNDRLIQVCHFAKNPSPYMQIQRFGVPFMFGIYQGETLKEIRGRIQKKLNVEDEEFSKWRLALVSLNRAQYLEDSDVLSSCLENDSFGAWGRYLGLEHSDNSAAKIAPKVAYVGNQNRRHTCDRSVKICN